jgi:TfoX/Sxy family transcriptional regulator of competence genes
VRALELAELLRAAGPIEVTRFFGGAALRMSGVQFAFVMKGTLYLRVGDGDRPDFEALGAAPFAYAGRSRTVTVASYYEVPGSIIENPDELGRWAVRARAAALAAGSAGRGVRPARRAPVAEGGA